MTITEIKENPDALEYKGLNILLIMNSPKISIRIKKAKTTQNRSITISDALSTSTVPISDSNETLSVFLSVPHLVISPNRGKAKFARYPIITAPKTFFTDGTSPSGSMSSLHRRALTRFANTETISDRATQK